MDSLQGAGDDIDFTQSSFPEPSVPNAFDFYLNFPDEPFLPGLGTGLTGAQPNDKNAVTESKPAKAQRQLLPRNVSDPAPTHLPNLFETSPDGVSNWLEFISLLSKRVLVLENSVPSFRQMNDLEVSNRATEVRVNDMESRITDMGIRETSLERRQTAVETQHRDL